MKTNSGVRGQKVKDQVHTLVSLALLYQNIIISNSNKSNN